MKHLLAVLTLVSTSVFAQTDRRCQVAAAPYQDCESGVFNLNASSGFNLYSWSPAGAVSNPYIANPTTTTPGSYTVTASTYLGPNLVNNWDFSGGNTGFTSGHTYTTVYSPCNYYVAPTFFTLPNSLADHTATTDNMFMSIDGCSNGPTVLWEQTITVTPNTNYSFAFWATRAHMVTPKFEVRFINSANNYTASPMNGLTYTGIWEWDQYNVQGWNSMGSASVTIQVVNLETNGYGNDFGMDDFSFHRSCTSTYTVSANGSLLGPNLFNNGDFSAGNTGFTSGHTYTSFYNPCNYYVAPTFFNTAFPYQDHTATSDNMFMSIDGCSNGPTVLWEQTVNVTPLTIYNFEFWATRADYREPIFEIHFIGDVTGDVIVGVQQGYTYNGSIQWDAYGIPCWNSEDNNTVTIRVINLETDPTGNDFGMDDFSFRQCCNPDQCCSGIPNGRISGDTDTETVNTLSVYPNPGNGSFTINLANAVEEDCTLYVVDVTGREVAQVKVNSGAQTATLDLQVSGVYFITMKTGNEQITYKLMVE